MLIARPVQQRQGLISRSHGGGYHREGGGLDVLLLGSSDELVSDCPRLVWFPPIRIDDCLARHPPRVSARDRERRLVYRQSILQSPGPVIRRRQDDLREVRIGIECHGPTGLVDRFVMAELARERRSAQRWRLRSHGAPFVGAGGPS